MQINLKQSAIIEALRLFIQNQGIDLTNRELDVKFTAGRKEAGITAEINITGTANPGPPSTPYPQPAPQAVTTTVIPSGPIARAPAVPQEPVNNGPVPDDGSVPPELGNMNGSGKPAQSLFGNS